MKFSSMLSPQSFSVIVITTIISFETESFHRDMRNKEMKFVAGGFTKSCEVELI